jgi:hypothetical protein
MRRQNRRGLRKAQVTSRLTREQKTRYNGQYRQEPRVPDHRTIISPLSRTITHDGRTVEVEIYRRGNEPWTFKVLNENGISIQWTEDYDTEKEASLAFDVDLERDGIESYDLTQPCPICQKLGLNH